MSLRQKTIVSLLLSGSSAVNLNRVGYFGNEFVGVNSPGMRGNEDLGLEISMGGQKFHLAQTSGLPKCDGSNGVVGLDCVSVLGYPRKTDGRPWAPMNDAYPEGHPRYASRAQINHPNLVQGPHAVPECTGSKGEEPGNNCMVVDINNLPTCNGQNGNPGKSCKQPVAKLEKRPANIKLDVASEGFIDDVTHPFLHQDGQNLPQAPPNQNGLI